MVFRLYVCVRGGLNAVLFQSDVHTRHKRTVYLDPLTCQYEVSIESVGSVEALAVYDQRGYIRQANHVAMVGLAQRTAALVALLTTLLLFSLHLLLRLLLPLVAKTSRSNLESSLLVRIALVECSMETYSRRATRSILLAPRRVIVTTDPLLGVERVGHSPLRLASPWKAQCIQKGFESSFQCMWNDGILF